MKFFKCNVCGNVVELIVKGGGQLVCCNESMELLVPKEQEAGNEKHLPVANMEGNQLSVKVGSIEHPMEEAHHIEFIVIKYNNHVERKNLKYTDKPEAVFTINEECDEIEIYEFCNLHGLWKTVFTK